MSPARVLFWHRRAVGYFNGNAHSAAPGSAVEAHHVQMITGYIKALRGG